MIWSSLKCSKAHGCITWAFFVLRHATMPRLGGNFKVAAYPGPKKFKTFLLPVLKDEVRYFPREKLRFADCLRLLFGHIVVRAFFVAPRSETDMDRFLDRIADAVIAQGFFPSLFFACSLLICTIVTYHGSKLFWARLDKLFDPPKKD